MNRKRRIHSSPAAVLAAGWLFAVNYSTANDDLPGPVRQGNGIFISDARIQELERRVTERIEPTWQAFLEVKRDADRARDREPHVPERWYVAPFYRDMEGHRRQKAGLEDDANGAYALALMYRISGDDRYAHAAVRLLGAWAGLEEISRADDSSLVFSYHFPAFLFAAGLLGETSVWSPVERERFETFVRERAVHQNTMDRANNQGNWGLVLAMACAVYLTDDELFARAVARWKEFVETQIAADGSLPHEVGRNRGTGGHGLWYSHFTLLPQTIAAEIARLNGVNLYDYVAPNGRSLRDAYQTLAPWTREPATFPFFAGENPEEQHRPYYASYFEILNVLWPHPDAEAVLAAGRPMRAQQSAPYLSFTHGGLGPISVLGE